MNYFVSVLLILCIIWWKWILLIAMSPLIIIKNRDGRRIKKNTCEKSINKSRSSFKKIKSVLSSYFNGAIMYFDVQIGSIPSHHLRNFLYKYVFNVKMDRYVILYNHCQIREHKRLYIGEGSIIGDHAILDARNGIKIGKFVNFSTGVQIWTEQHDHRDSYFRCNSDDTYKVVIGDRAWLGPRTLILHSVNIGEGAVVAAGAVVTKDVPPFSIVAGIPAKVIGHRNTELKYEFNGIYVPMF